MEGKLISRNVTVGGHRTSIRLERTTWEALEEICRLEDITIHELCTKIEQRREHSSRTAAVRAFIVTYFRTAATSCGGLHRGVIESVLPGATA